MKRQNVLSKGVSMKISTKAKYQNADCCKHCIYFQERYCNCCWSEEHICDKHNVKGIDKFKVCESFENA